MLLPMTMSDEGFWLTETPFTATPDEPREGPEAGAGEPGDELLCPFPEEPPDEDPDTPEELPDPPLDEPEELPDPLPLAPEDPDEPEELPDPVLLELKDP